MAKKQKAKKKASAPKQPAKKSSTNLLLKNINDQLKTHSLKVMAGLFVLSLLISGIYYAQGNKSPVNSIHHWDNSDMAFFDTWATYLAKGNWMCDTVLHPYHDWHDDFAASWLQSYPTESEVYYQDPNGGPRRSDLEAKKALINDIYKGKTFHQEPLYTYMVAITYAIFGKNLKWIHFWNFLLAALTSVLVYLIGRRQFNELTGVLGAVFMTLCGTILVYQMVLFRTTLTNFFTVLILYTYMRMLKEPDRKNLILFGVSSGFALLAQSYFILFLIPAWLWFAWEQRENLKSFATRFSIIMGSMLIVLSPLFIRNLSVGVPLTAMAGHGAMAYIPMNTTHAAPMESFYVHMPTLVKLRHDGNGKMIKTAFLCLDTFTSFGDFWRIYKQKINGMFMWYEIPNNMNYYLYREWAPVLAQLPVRYFFIAPLGLVGLVLGFYRYRFKLIPFFLMVLASIIPILIAGNLARYRTPLVILLSLTAAYCLYKLVEWMVNKEYKQALIGGGLCVVAFLYTANTVNSAVHLVGSNDLHVMYYFHYRDKLLKLEEEGNGEEYLATTTDLMKNLPDYYFDKTMDDPITNSKDADACLYAVNLIRMHASMLEGANRPEDAGYYTQQADILAARANRFKEKMNLK